jgi:hypothetical protein
MNQFPFVKRDFNSALFYDNYEEACQAYWKLKGFYGPYNTSSFKPADPVEANRVKQLLRDFKLEKQHRRFSSQFQPTPAQGNLSNTEFIRILEDESKSFWKSLEDTYEDLVEKEYGATLHYHIPNKVTADNAENYVNKYDMFYDQDTNTFGYLHAFLEPLRIVCALIIIIRY